VCAPRCEVYSPAHTAKPSLVRLPLAEYALDKKHLEYSAEWGGREGDGRMAQRTCETHDGAAGVHNCRLRVQQAVHSRVARCHGGRLLSV
jgi:hypothetical protein